MKRQKFFLGQERQKLKALIREKTGYAIVSNCLLSQAFRRRSWCAENDGKSNEMLEFIGDHVLSYYTVKIISDRCASLNIEGDYSFRIHENSFTAFKQELLSNASFAAIIDDWAIVDYLIVGRSDEANRVDQEQKVKADLFEAIIGAIALDCKWDPSVLEAVVNKTLGLDVHLQKIIENSSESKAVHIDNAISLLKELAEKEQCSMPKYDFVGPESLGYDEDGNPIWCCTCSVINDITGIIRQVWASSKGDAKKAAAYLVLCEHLQLQNQYGRSKHVSGWRYHRDGRLEPM